MKDFSLIIQVERAIEIRHEEGSIPLLEGFLCQVAGGGIHLLKMEIGAVTQLKL